MPDEDGYVLIREIRSRGSHIPAIAITALGSAEDRARAMAEGFDAHLTKPWIRRKWWRRWRGASRGWA